MSPRTVVVGLFAVLLTSFPSLRAEEEIDFAHQVAPLLKTHCAECHAGAQKKGGLSINSRESLLAGGESGAAISVGQSDDSEIYYRVIADDAATRMPPEGAGLSEQEVGVLVRWIDQGAKWEAGFTFGPKLYEPPLLPRQPTLPPAIDGRSNPVDRILDTYLAQQELPRPELIDDAAFVRRVYLDLIGLLPTPEESRTFIDDPSNDKRTRLVHQLLQRDIDYAEHWLTFWNDLLRNDYTGTGFITGGRKQISKWLYDALVSNKPYDEFARQLIAPPTPESAGFADGIRWRGEVSAGQTVEIQFAQSVGQAFLGINLKCASCHDSFVDRWTLEDAYGLAAIYAERPLELHRCDKPIGKMAEPAWLFDEIGQVTAAAPRPQRLQQLADLLTDRQNGRFTRTIVNRLWHRLMGRGIVHPTDAMQTEPWNADLLDYLAEDLVAHDYDLKSTLALIATSQAYQSQAQRVTDETDANGYRYAGPRSKRLTAEQFVDLVWQLTGAAPNQIDAPVTRGGSPDESDATQSLAGQWIWNRAVTGDSKPGETIVLKRSFSLDQLPASIVGVASCDNAYRLYLNGRLVQEGSNWEAPDLLSQLPVRVGENELLVVASNAGSSPNPAGFYCQLQWQDATGETNVLATDHQWQWTKQLPDKSGKFAAEVDDWQPATAVTAESVWMDRLRPTLIATLSRGTAIGDRMVRASLVKSDFLMRSLGRPNRDQIVTVRPLELTTLEAIDLSNGAELAGMLSKGAQNLSARQWQDSRELVHWLYQFALCRPPTPEEEQILTSALGANPRPTDIEDVLWAVVVLPEFQLVH